MRSNVQDLIQLDTNPADTSDRGAAGSGGRFKGRDTKTDFPAERLGFDMLLALAAGFPLPINQTTAARLGLPNFVGPLSDQQAAASGEVGTSVESIFEGATGYGLRMTAWQAQPEMFANTRLPDSDSGKIVVEPAQVTAAQILELVDGPRRDGRTRFNEAGATNLATQNTGEPAILRGTPTPDRTVAGPDLRIVTRNEDPVTAVQNTRPADLRVIYSDGSISNIRPVVDLVERLSDRWRTSFLGDDIEATEFPLEPAGPRRQSRDEEA